MVDRLGLIEHEINWCNTYECDGPAIEDPDELGTCDECGSPLERVKVVRADKARAAASGIAAWLREQATGERTEDPGSDQLELIADFIERHHPTLGGQ